MVGDLLADPEQRAAMGRRGTELIAAEHTFAHRADRFADLLPPMLCDRAKDLDGRTFEQKELPCAGPRPDTVRTVATFCAACATWTRELRKDSRGRQRGCPTCYSLERQRVLGILLPSIAAQMSTRPVVLDVAPSRALDALLRELGTVVRMDFDPAADGRLVDVRASLTAIPVPDGRVDLLVCSHVLEHVPDDRSAMHEIARVLSPDGIGVVLVPIRLGRPTEEDPTASPEERVTRFGQADHVRYYGDDFSERLTNAGLAWTEFTAADVLDQATLELIAAIPTERFWLVRPASCGKPDLKGAVGRAQVALHGRLAVAAERQIPAPMPQVQGAPQEDVGTLRRRLRVATNRAARAEADAQKWEAAYRWRRGRPPVRMLAFGGRILRSANSAATRLKQRFSS